VLFILLENKVKKINIPNPKEMSSILHFVIVILLSAYVFALDENFNIFYELDNNGTLFLIGQIIAWILAFLKLPFTLVLAAHSLILIERYTNRDL